MTQNFDNLPEKDMFNKGVHVAKIFGSKIPMRSDVFSTVEWERTSVTTGSGKVIKDVEFPTFWSDNARIQVAEKYFRRADVPQFPIGIYDRHAAAELGIDINTLPRGAEKSLKHVINRMAGCLTHWGVEYGYFTSQESAKNYYNELAYMMIHQYGALNSPQWFNTGMHWAYGIEGDAKGQYHFDFELNKAVKSINSFEHPQGHACFILGVKDDLFGPNGIFDTARREAQIFYFGSGSGSNYSTLRGKGEPVSGGGISSGMMSFLDIYDVGGGAIKSGGKTRRAAKMDICSDTHPEIIDFIEWKMRQEKIVRILVESGMSAGFEDEAYKTVRGMNSNNTVAFSHKFFDALRNNENWQLRWVTDPTHVCAEMPAKELWDKTVYATWFSADPGLHATDTINEWHTCPEDGRINSSNPCSEYLFLDETACNLASINLVKFFDSSKLKEHAFDTSLFMHAINIWQIALDITVSMAQYPAEDICNMSIQYRTTGLGYTNLGGLLMLMGHGYASKEGQQIAGAITAILGGASYMTSAKLASVLGAYPAYERNKRHHLRVIRNHLRASAGTTGDIHYGQGVNGKIYRADYENITKAPKGLDMYACPKEYWHLIDTAERCWTGALRLGEEHGYRNAQTTVLAPTGTISFAMDADTFGIEPDYALIKYKALSGGGYAVIVNRLIEPSLRGLGYTDEQIEEIISYVHKTGMIEKAPHVDKKHYSVFDTAVPATKGGRYLQPFAHIEMMAACQPFLSGAISKTINLPEEATEKDISDAYLYGYDLGLKAIAVYRANSKAASVMFTNAEDLKNRTNIDLGTTSFDIKQIFRRAVGLEPEENSMRWMEELSEQPMIGQDSEDTPEEPCCQNGACDMAAQLEMPDYHCKDNECLMNVQAEAIEMPTYGCKDGVCSI